MIKWRKNLSQSGMIKKKIYINTVYIYNIVYIQYINLKLYSMHEAVLGVTQVHITLLQDGSGSMWAAWSPPCWLQNWSCSGKPCIPVPSVWLSPCTVSQLHGEPWGKAPPSRRDCWPWTSDPHLDMMCSTCQPCWPGSLWRRWAFSCATQTRAGVWSFMKPWHRVFILWTEARWVNPYWYFTKHSSTSNCHWDQQDCSNALLECS